ncbi:hypothetical protein F2Q68_00012829 [Brassica cretica]|uniref:Uncharacterized protein n=1 Tax=Brassica cretica TaxID=69181 RepID=A0A8S9HKX5_BRACR|nr:hypothetical protein F2Q68_00012829 [Brassica cretica]
MSSTARNISGGGNRKSSRLQRRAPPPLKINPSEGNWKVPIPLLSPTESPPPKPPMVTKRDEQRWGKEGSTERLDARPQTCGSLFQFHYNCVCTG